MITITQRMAPQPIAMTAIVLGCLSGSTSTVHSHPFTFHLLLLHSQSISDRASFFLFLNQFDFYLQIKVTPLFYIL